MRFVHYVFYVRYSHNHRLRGKGVKDSLDHPLDEERRNFLRKAVTTATVVGIGTSGVGAATAKEKGNNGRGPLKGDPFTLGVASGDPLPDSVVLWTRLAPEPLSEDGGMPDRQVPVQWEIATDEDMKNTVGKGNAKARPEYAHSVHIDVKGLDAGTEYYYQFKIGPDRSPVGRTKTAPAEDTNIDEFRFAFASCQNYPAGYYTAHDHLADEDLDLAVHLGDYIYEGGGQGSLGRGHEPPREIESLSEYRIREAQHKTDSNLQDAHAAFPWLVTWDDHEVENNYADEVSQADDPTEEFLERRADAYQAYFEHQPLRPSRMPDGPNLPLYRRFTFGDLAEFNVLDTRQYRDDQVYSSEEASDPERTILGDEQEDWLVAGLNSSTSQWNVLANQVPVAATDENPNPDVQDFGGGDKWDGYRADRQTLLDTMAADEDLNPVVITGDVHRNYAYNLKADFSDPNSETVGTEYVGTSITSFGDGSGITQYGPSLGEPWQRFYNDERGYVRCTLTPDQWQTDYRVVSTVEEPEASVSTIATFTTDAGDPGAELTSEPPEREPIEIIEVEPDQNGDLNNEFAKLQNTGDSEIDLSGFIVSFEGGRGQNYTFDDVSVGPDEVITVRNGDGDDTQSTVYTGFSGAVLNNSNPDIVVVANDDGVVLDEQSYTPA
ncbi:alkaline phosphatase D family protein [Halococcus salsus]|uniref:alkaline phosphatase D family protein n=1 Tax=Halococcus salsus TaxID=2162894 RepID=UPI001356FCA2|nr:alkaline phosphatase D family protein [Halococcus salsus]